MTLLGSVQTTSLLVVLILSLRQRQNTGGPGQVKPGKKKHMRQTAMVPQVVARTVVMNMAG